MLLSADAAVPAVLVWKTGSGDIRPVTTLLSGLLCLVAVNAVVLIAICRRNQRRGQSTSKWMLLGATGLGFLFALATGAAVFAMPQHNPYLDLAFSGVPLSSIQPEQKRLVVELIRRRAANSREYDILATEAKLRPIFPSLYTPESFANEQVIESTLAQLTKAAEVDFQYSQQQQAAMSDFRQKMAEVDPEYLRLWDIERKGQEAAEQSAIRLEHEWLESTVSLYEYAGSHSKEISLLNGRLKFATDAAQLDFNTKQDHSKALYQKWQDVTQGLIQFHQESRAKVGLP